MPIHPASVHCGSISWCRKGIEISSLNQALRMSKIFKNGDSFVPLPKIGD